MLFIIRLYLWCYLSLPLSTSPSVSCLAIFFFLNSHSFAKLNARNSQIRRSRQQQTQTECTTKAKADFDSLTWNVRAISFSSVSTIHCTITLTTANQCCKRLLCLIFGFSQKVWDNLQLGSMYVCCCNECVARVCVRVLTAVIVIDSQFKWFRLCPLLLNYWVQLHQPFL